MMFDLSAGLFLLVAVMWLSGVAAAIYLSVRLQSRR
jgi:hypothetical protein